MAPAIVHANSGSSTGAVTTYSLAFANAVTAGNTLLAYVNAGGGATFTWTMSDDVNGAWTGITGSYHGYASRQWFYLGSTAAGTPTVTVTPNASSAVFLQLHEVSGLAQPVVVEDAQTADDANSTNNQATFSVSLTTSTDGDLILAGAVISGVFSAYGTGGFAQAAPSLASAIFTEYVVQSTHGSIAAGLSQTTSTNWSMSAIALQASVVGGPWPTFRSIPFMA